VRTFTLATATDIRNYMDAAIGDVGDASLSLSNKWGASTEEHNADPFCHTFVENLMELNQFTCRHHWHKFVDVAHVVSAFSLRLGLDELFRIFRLARSAGNGFLAKSTFEIYVRRLAEDNKLYVSEFDPDNKELQNLHMTRLGLKTGNAVCSETSRYQVPTKAHINELEGWRGNRREAYMSFLAWYGLQTVDAIVKLEPRPDKRSSVAYLCIALSPDLGTSIDVEQQKTMNTVFSAAANADPPLYIFVCPDLAACKALVANPPPEATLANTTCHLLVGNTLV
jgi:hypothetical protein